MLFTLVGLPSDVRLNGAQSAVLVIGDNRRLLVLSGLDMDSLLSFLVWTSVVDDQTTHQIGGQVCWYVDLL